MATINLELREQANLNGSGAPYTVNFPLGSNTSATPTGVRNISDQALEVVFFSDPSEAFWEPRNQAGLVTFTGTLNPGDSALFVFVDGKGWTQFHRFSEVPTSYQLSVTTGPIAPGASAVMAWEDVPGSVNPLTDFALLAGGTVIEAQRQIQITFEMFEYVNMIAAGNNQEIRCSIQVVSVLGATIDIQVAMIDSFQTTRVGTFPRSHGLPAGKVFMNAGDQISFDAINDITSTMDFEVVNALLIIEPRFELENVEPARLVQPIGDPYLQPNGTDFYLVRG